MNTVRTDVERVGHRLGWRRGRALGITVAFGVGVAMLAGGCHKKQQAAAVPPPAYTGNVAPTATAPATAPATATAAPPTATAAALDDATKLALAAMIDARAPKEAAGMKPIGEPFGGSAAAGGQVDSPVFMVEQAKCYVVLAQGGLGVTELDIKLLGGAGLVPAGLEPTLAVDNTAGATAAITPCWKPLIGGPAKVALVARGGSGPVAARIYAK